MDFLNIPSLNHKFFNVLYKVFCKYVPTLCFVKKSDILFFRSGGNLEVMGLLLGKVDANVMVVMDAFALPVEGTETRVNVQSEGFEYMTAYVEAAKRVGRLEHVLGWYHSHPGYGCWLSGIDVSTQALNQNFQDPFLAGKCRQVKKGLLVEFGQVFS